MTDSRRVAHPAPRGLPDAGALPAVPHVVVIGAGIAGMLYLIIAQRQPHYADVSGEAIAVDNVSH